MNVDVPIVTKINNSCKVFHIVVIVATVFENNDILGHVKLLIIISSEGNFFLKNKCCFSSNVKMLFEINVRSDINKKVELNYQVYVLATVYVDSLSTFARTHA